MTNNIPMQRALMQVRELQAYVQSVDSMPELLADGLLQDLDFISSEIEYYNGDVEPKPEPEPSKSKMLFDFFEEYANDYTRLVDIASDKLDDMFVPTMEKDNDK